MDAIILIESEFRSLIRNFLTRLIGKNIKKKNKNFNILFKISIRTVSSLIAIQIFNMFKKIPEIRNYISYIMIIVFVIFYIQESK